MDTAATFPAKRLLLYLLVASVLMSAFLGIVAIVSGQFGWIETRIILTTVTIAVASICGLACGAYLGTRPGHTLPLAGIVLALLAAAMIILGMWIDVQSEVFWKLTASVSVFAVTCAHSSLLSMVRLAESFRWSLITAYVVIFGVASLIVVMLAFEINEMEMFQFLGVAAVVDAAMTILVPLFHRLSRPEFTPKGDRMPTVETETIDAEIAKLQARITELEGMKHAGFRSSAMRPS